ncbi:maleylpyruvate isomerase [Micromonospora pattaloongensis]|uniref:Maleylpyruvate isomerase n=1 Tax=Micromonospora pattaloongensis TaxID=405436 RepID=A0A1H3Q9Q9_9ACTN|nr:maleylpyruvate isomerase family mycothiol-dependent enzyme [Micromonospora pattaloongensis]SDZ10274.1 maleylpyruvate isomerase [Micromonospora pattaloongensis]
MTVDPLGLMAEVDRATDRLLRTVAGLRDDELRTPSLLPGWTRGHVLAHIARNADGYVDLLTAAATGARVPQRVSVAARDTDIEADAHRPLAAHLADLRDSASRFADAVNAMPAPGWRVEVEPSLGPRRPAAMLMWGRLREVEVHHVDLRAGYTAADWPEAFSHRLLHEVVTGYGGRGDAPPLVLSPADAGHALMIGEADGAPRVSGPAHSLAGWLTGRGDGDGLTIAPTGPLPTPPIWM